MKRYSWLICIIAVAAGIRMLFSVTFPAKLMWTGDTTSYFGTAIRMQKLHLISDPWRTPLYPMLLALPYYLQGKPLPAEYPQEFTYELWSIRIAQGFAGILTVVILFLLLKRLGVGDRWAGLYCLFIACNTTMMAFEYTILTEAFSTLWLVSVLYVCTGLVHRVSWVQFAWLTILLLVGVFLRPLYLVLPFILIPLTLWRHRSANMVAMATCSLLLYVGIMLGYMQINMRQNGYFGISRISDVNLLGKILVLNIPVDTTLYEGDMKTLVAGYIQTVPVPDPWQVFVSFPQLYHVASAGPLSNFVRQVVVNNLGTFFVRSTAQLPRAIMDVSEIADFYDHDLPLSPLYPLFRALHALYHGLQAINMIVIVAIPLCVYLLFKKPTERTMMMLALTFVAGYHLVFGVYLGYADYGRHLLPMQPIVYFVSLYWWRRMIVYIRTVCL